MCIASLFVTADGILILLRIKDDLSQLYIEFTVQMVILISACAFIFLQDEHIFCLKLQNKGKGVR